MVAIVLRLSADWDDWTQMVKTKAGDVWQFIDPDAESAPVLSAPILPKPYHVAPTRTKFSELNEDEKDELAELRFLHKMECRRYERQCSDILGVALYIRETLARRNHVFIFNKHHPREMLLALKASLEPSEYIRRLDANVRYNRLKEPPQEQDIEKWLSSWETTCWYFENFNIRVVPDEMLLFDFLEALSKVSPKWASGLQFTMRRLQSKADDLPNVYALIDHYREDRLENESNTLE